VGKIIAISNQKGGVGKTTTAINLATSLTRFNKSVLLVDMDPQSNLTSGVGLKGRPAPGGTVYDALTSETPTKIDDFIIPTPVKDLFLIPADRHLTGAEIELVGMEKRESRLKPLVNAAACDRFDFIFIDTPPSLGLLTLNSLVAADEVIIPLTCEYFALEGLAELTATLQQVNANLNKSLVIAGVLLTMADSRTNLGRQVAKEVRDHFKEKVFNTVIPRNIRLGEAPSHGLPAILYDRRSKGAEAYLALAEEIISGQAMPADTKESG
jgi:chromosome partitioning protein